jgi:hypothetical protein
VELYDAHVGGVPWQTWILKPERVGGAFTPTPLLPEILRVATPPPNGGIRIQHAEYENDGFGTTVTEVTTVTNTTTTRRRYRVEDT